MTSSLDREAEKMLRVPGIIFADGESGRRAQVAGTGLDVFEVILNYLAVGRNWNRLKLCFPQATEGQLRAAVTYCETYPDEIDGEIAENSRFTPEYVYSRYSFTKPTAR